MHPQPGHYRRNKKRIQERRKNNELASLWHKKKAARQPGTALCDDYYRLLDQFDQFYRLPVLALSHFNHIDPWPVTVAQLNGVSAGSDLF